MSLLEAFKNIFGKKERIPREEIMRTFKKRYVSFKELLQSNTDLANTMAILETSLRGEDAFSINNIRSEATKAVFHAMRMVMSLNAISGNKYRALAEQVEDIDKRIRNELEQRLIEEIADFTLPLGAITASHTFNVGGKSANLAQIGRIENVVIPRGFAITTTTYNTFMRQNGLMDEARKITRNINLDQPESIAEVSERISAMLLATPLPPEVENALHSAWLAAFGDNPNTIAAMRSSAVSEDGSSSFAGQYLTVLGVRREGLPGAYRQVVASLFSPRAITYRLRQGFVIDQCAMGVCCLEMVDAVAAGVAFSRHPVDPASEDIVINGLWGLGELVVDGAAEPDSWLVPRSGGSVSSSSIAIKPECLRLGPDGKPVLSPVPEKQREAPCLSEEQVFQVAKIAITLERHYHHPQDLEWALDSSGQIILLQSRPMLLADGRETQDEAPPIPEGAQLILAGGETASSGIGCGTVFVADTDDDLSQFPAGGVLVARHSSPNFVVVMDRAEAIVADRGSITGHMASVCREFAIPALLNLKDASSTLQNGMTITVDATSGRIYAGEIAELLSLKKPRAVDLNETPVHALLRRVSGHILPLHLIDPKSEMFSPENCTSLHDVMRFAHELSYTEMFKLSDSAADAGAVALPMRCNVPLDLHVIDLGGGVIDVEKKRFLCPPDISCAPFKALLAGMLLPDVHAKGPRPVDMQGLLHVMGQSMIGGHGQGERFGDRSYAIISDRYINFSSRVGYHYAILDAWCGDTMNKNYISFKFAGGAADTLRRERRVQCIGLILKRLGFSIDILGDRIQARFQKYQKHEIEERLDQVGRLLIMTRQMDMLMVNTAAVELFADNFINGKYH